MMKQIELTQGQVALVDDCDFDWLTAMGSWCVEKGTNTFYAKRRDRRDGKWRTLRMHRAIMEKILGHSDFKQVDHIDGDGLNNQRSNLRPVTNAQNSMNRGARSNNAHGFKGVVWHKRQQKWNAQITVNGKKIHLGYFPDTPEGQLDAICARNQAVLKHQGRYGQFTPVRIRVPNSNLKGKDEPIPTCLPTPE